MIALAHFHASFITAFMPKSELSGERVCHKFRGRKRGFTPFLVRPSDLEMIVDMESSKDDDAR